MALERPDDILGCQRLAIMKLDILPDMEIPFGQIVRALDTLCQTVLDLTLRRDPDKQIAELAGQVKRHLACRKRGIERIRSRAAAKAETKRAALFWSLGTNGAAEHGARRRCGHTECRGSTKEGATAQLALGRALHQKFQLVAHQMSLDLTI